MKNLWRAIHKYIVLFFLYALPLGLLVLIVPVSSAVEKWIDSPIIAVIFIAWFLSSLYFLAAILLSSAFREEVLSRLARIRERDEREEYIVGRATKSSFLFTLAFAIVLFAVSTFRYSESTTAPKEYQAFTIGHFNLKSCVDESFTKNVDGKEHLIRRYDIPLSKSSLLLLMILVQVMSYHIFARRYAGGSHE
jgi:hypothetical protein